MKYFEVHRLGILNWISSYFSNFQNLKFQSCKRFNGLNKILLARSPFLVQVYWVQIKHCKTLQSTLTVPYLYWNNRSTKGNQLENNKWKNNVKRRRGHWPLANLKEEHLTFSDLCVLTVFEKNLRMRKSIENKHVEMLSNCLEELYL